MLNKDQRERLNLLKTMAGEDLTKAEALEALEKNFWDTAMAFEWIKRKKENPDISQEAFHQEYDTARQKAAVLPQDRYDLNNNKKKEAPANRASRRAAKKKEKKK